MLKSPARNHDDVSRAVGAKVIRILDVDHSQAASPRALQSPPPLMLPPRKCAEALGLPEYTVRQWLKTGFIKSIPCGRKQLINVETLRRKLEEV